MTGIRIHFVFCALLLVVSGCGRGSETMGPSDDNTSSETARCTMVNGPSEIESDLAVPITDHKTSESIVSDATIAHWSFNAIMGCVVYDVSGNGHHGVMQNGAFWDESCEGCQGGAVRFDGNDDFVQVTHSPDFEIAEGTIEIVFRPAGGFSVGDPSQQLIDKERGGFYDGDLEIYLAGSAEGNGRLTVEVEDGSRRYYIRSSRTLWDDTWYHVAYVFDASGMRLYIDGVLQPDENPFPAGLVNNHWPLTFGYNYSQSTAAFDGCIEEIRISDRALSPSDFLQCASTTVALDIKPGSCPNPINAKSRGKLSVAILGTAVFDVRDVDISSLLLEGIAPLRSSIEDVSTPVENGEGCECTGDGPDGYDDLTLKFQTQDIIDVIGPVSPGDVKVMTIAGALMDGTPFEASDCVVIVGGQRHPGLTLLEGASNERVGAK